MASETFDYSQLDEKPSSSDEEEEQQEQQEQQEEPKKSGGRRPGSGRKKGYKMALKENLTLDPEDFANITLTRTQYKTMQKIKMKQLEKEERAITREKQKAVAIANLEKHRKTLDLRKDKTKEGITLKIAAPRAKRVLKTAEQRAEELSKKIENVVVEYSPEEAAAEEEAHEQEVQRRISSFQARKPKLEDEIEEKVQKLQQINTVLQSNNPYLDMIMKARLG
jgi:hypothetical protein